MPRLPLTDADVRRLETIVPRLPVAHGVTGLRATPLAEHASSRSYHRLHLEGPAERPPRVPTLVVMKLGPDPLKSDERIEGPRPTRLPFVDVGEALADAGVPVPAIHADHSDEGLVVLEDLGDETFADRLDATERAHWRDWYERAVTLLARFHAAEPAVRKAGAIAAERRFGADLLRWELDHFREWGLEARDVNLGSAARRTLETAFDRIVARLGELPQGLSHRDFQSRNLMVTGRGLVVIDFQDALRAPVVYDLVALLRDSYVVLTAAEVDHALVRYDERRRDLGLAPVPLDALREGFRWQTVQRKLKDAGRFVFIERVKGDPSFLRFVADSIGYVREAVEGLPELRELEKVLADCVPEWNGMRGAEETGPQETGPQETGSGSTS